MTSEADPAPCDSCGGPAEADLGDRRLCLDCYHGLSSCCAGEEIDQEGLESA